MPSSPRGSRSPRLVLARGPARRRRAGSSEEKELVETQLARQLLAQEVGRAGVHPTRRGDHAEAPTGCELLDSEPEEVVEVIGLAPVDALPGRDSPKAVAE